MPLKTLSGRHADPHKGRGAGINPEGRFENVMREAFDDGWGAPSEGGTGAPLGDVTPETDAAPALDGAAPDSRTFASRKREPCSLLAGAAADDELTQLKTHV